MKRKFSLFLTACIALLLVLSPENAYAWSPRTHYYGALKYSFPQNATNSEWIAGGAGFLDFGRVSLDKKTGISSDGIEMINYFNDHMIDILLQGNDRAISYMVGMRVHYNQDRGLYNADVFTLDDLRAENGLERFYYPNALPAIKPIINSISYLDAKAYVDTYIKRYKMSSSSEQNYQNIKYQVPLFFVKSAYKDLRKVTVTDEQIYDGLAKSQLLSDAYNLRFFFYKYSDKEHKMLDKFLDNNMAKASYFNELTTNKSTYSSLSLDSAALQKKYLSMSKDELRREFLIQEQGFSRAVDTSIGTMESNSYTEAMNTYIENKINSLKASKAVSYSAMQNASIKEVYDVTVNINNTNTYEQAVKDIYNYSESLKSNYFAPEDVNFDGQINTDDLNIVFENKGPINDVTKRYDINKDGIVDVYDFTMIAKKIQNSMVETQPTDTIGGPNSTPSGYISASMVGCILGKGTSGLNPGEGIICFFDKQYPVVTALKLNSEQGYTPIKLISAQGRNLYFIAGVSDGVKKYGSTNNIVYGGNLYSVNLDTLSVYTLSECMANEEIVDAKMNGSNQINLSVNKYDSKHKLLGTESRNITLYPKE